MASLIQTSTRFNENSSTKFDDAMRWSENYVRIMNYSSLVCVVRAYCQKCWKSALNVVKNCRPIPCFILFELGFLEKEIRRDEIPMLDTGESPDAPAPREMIDLEVTRFFFNVIAVQA